MIRNPFCPQIYAFLKIFLKNKKIIFCFIEINIYLCVEKYRL